MSDDCVRKRRRTKSGPSFVVPNKKSGNQKLKKNSLNLKPSKSEDEESWSDDDNSDIIGQMKTYLDEAEEMAKNAVKSGVHQAEEMAKNAVKGVHQAEEMAKNAVKTGVHHAEELAKDVYERIWKAIHYEKLPGWLKDNEHLHFGHRPEMNSFSECFKSIFRIHTETGNIWTHLIGFIAFVVVTIIFYVKPLCATCALDINLSEKLIFLCFFIGAIFCLACSTLFHTVSCHSEWASTVFSRLDYAGIAFLIVGSIIPWLYYGFYCQFYAKLTYIIAVSVFGILTIILTMWDRFNMPDFRVYRTIVFVGLAGVSSLPVIHYIANRGLYTSMMEVSMQCTIIMGALYLTGALLYATRIPERFLPGKCDIWFQSHQIFHVLVIAAAFVHYHGISEMAMDRLRSESKCLDHFEPELNPDSVIGGAVY